MRSPKKWMVLGLPSSGKTALADWIEGLPGAGPRRQDLHYRPRTIDVPGMYIENAWLNNAIITIAQNHACGVLFLVDGSTGKSLYSPAYANVFTVPTLGIVSKCDLATDESLAKAIRALKDAGLDAPLAVSTVTVEGLDALRTRMQNAEQGREEERLARMGTLQSSD